MIIFSRFYFCNIKAEKEVIQEGLESLVKQEAKEVGKEGLEKLAKEESERLAKEAIEKQYDEIANNGGHSVQRHGTEVMERQLDARAIEGKDPITGTTDDAFRKDASGNPLPHKTNKNATKFTNKESLVKAEKYVKNTQEYKNALANAKANNLSSFSVKDVKLQDIFGSQYKKEVFGKTRIGTKNNPTGASLTDFTDGSVKAVFQKDSKSKWNLYTMYAEPK